MGKKINIGDMVAISETWKKRGQQQAITAWENKSPFGLNFFSHQPQKSEDYQEWFDNLAKSAAWVKNIDENWIFVKWAHIEAPLWMPVRYFNKL